MCTRCLRTSTHSSHPVHPVSRRVDIEVKMICTGAVRGVTDGVNCENNRGTFPRTSGCRWGCYQGQREEVRRSDFCHFIWSDVEFTRNGHKKKVESFPYHSRRLERQRLRYPFVLLIYYSGVRFQRKNVHHRVRILGS